MSSLRVDDTSDKAPIKSGLDAPHDRHEVAGRTIIGPVKLPRTTGYVTYHVLSGLDLGEKEPDDIHI